MGGPRTADFLDFAGIFLHSRPRGRAVRNSIRPRKVRCVYLESGGVGGIRLGRAHSPQNRSVSGPASRRYFDRAPRGYFYKIDRRFEVSGTPPPRVGRGTLNFGILGGVTLNLASSPQSRPGDRPAKSWNFYDFVGYFATTGCGVARYETPLFCAK